MQLHCGAMCACPRHLSQLVGKLTIHPLKQMCMIGRYRPATERVVQAHSARPRGGLVLGGSGSSAAHSGGMPPSGIVYAY